MNVKIEGVTHFPGGLTFQIRSSHYLPSKRMSGGKRELSIQYSKFLPFNKFQPRRSIGPILVKNIPKRRKNFQFNQPSFFQRILTFRQVRYIFWSNKMLGWGETCSSMERVFLANSYFKKKKSNCPRQKIPALFSSKKCPHKGDESDASRNRAKLSSQSEMDRWDCFSSFRGIFFFA